MNQTIQRSALLDELRRAGGHLTAGELHRRLRDKVPQISLGTIYRNIEELAGCGAIGKVEFAGRPRCFEARVDSHYHLRCRRCGRIVDLPAESAVRLDRFFKKFLPDCRCDSVKIEFDGCCPDCRGQEDASG